MRCFAWILVMGPCGCGAGSVDSDEPVARGVAPADWPAPTPVDDLLVADVTAPGPVDLQICAAPEDLAAGGCAPWAGDELVLRATSVPEAFTLALAPLTGAGLPLPPDGGLQDYHRVFGLDAPLADVAFEVELTVAVGPQHSADALAVWALASGPPPLGGKFPSDLRWERVDADLDASTGHITADVEGPAVVLVANPTSGTSGDEAPTFATGEAHFAFAGRHRRAVAYTPASGARPLVVVLHGSGQDAEVPVQWGWERLADRDGVHLLRVEGTWGGDEPLGGSFLWSGRVDPADGLNPGFRENLDYLEVVLDAAEAQLDVLDGHTFVTGFSGGGILTHRVGAELAHRVDAIAPVAALGIGSGDDDPHPPPTTDTVSVLTVMGQLDPSHPYDGDDSRPGAVEGAEAWAERFGCGAAVLEQVEPDITRHTWPCADDDVVLLSVRDGEHDYTMLDPHGPGTVEIVADFFLQHPH